MKKLSAIILALMLLLSIYPASAEQNIKYTCDGYTYKLLEDDSAMITGVAYYIHGDIVIPNELDGHPVTSIGYYAFHNNRKITGITIPEGVTEIQQDAFSECGAVSINIPSSVKAIGNSAFRYCDHLEEIVIPEGVTSIEYYTFTHCDSLKKVVLPESLTQIGNQAFGLSRNLETINIPEGVTEIPANAFWGCSFTHITIPEGVTAIHDAAFMGCEQLEEIIIPDSVTTIGNNAFCGCTNLGSIVLPAGKIEIGKDAFKDTAYTLAAEKMMPESFDGAEDYRETGWQFPEGKKLFTSSTDMYFLMPESIRTLDAREADYMLVKRTRRQSRNDYSGSAHDTITELYLCGADGTVALLCSITHSPPAFGRVKIGQSLGGSVATDAELWEKIMKFFPQAGQAD